MATYVFYADKQEKLRADGINTVVAQGITEAAAREAAETLIGEPGALSSFKVVDVSAAAPAFLVQGHPPVGAPGQSSWLRLTRGGDTLRAT